MYEIAWDKQRVNRFVICLTKKHEKVPILGMIYYIEGYLRRI